MKLIGNTLLSMSLLVVTIAVLGAVGIITVSAWNVAAKTFRKYFSKGIYLTD